MSITQDVAYSLRLMRKAPLFTAAVVLTIGLAIAATATIFSVVNAQMLRPLPFKDPDRLLLVFERNDKLNAPIYNVSVLNFLDWRAQTQSFDLAAVNPNNNFTLTGMGDPEQLVGNRISPGLLRVLGVPLIAGRPFTPEEEKPGAAPVAIIGEAFRQSHFGKDEDALGRTINLDGTPTTIVGIAPATLNLLSAGDIYIPLVIDPAKEMRLSHAIFVVGRLKPGVSAQQAQAEMNTISDGMKKQYPELQDWGVNLVTMFDGILSPQIKTGLLVLLAAVSFVLLIACANVANLLLARTAARQHEMAVRTALGASQGRLVRQLLIESVTLSCSGGLAGLLATWWSVRAMSHWLPPNMLPIPTIEVDSHVLLFALGTTVLTGLIFGIVPALRTAKVKVDEVLKTGGRAGSGGIRTRMRNILVAIELALATMLLIGAGLFIQTLVNLQSVKLGFEPHGLITFQVSLPPGKYPPNTEAPLFYREMIESLEALPGVRGASVSSGIPFGAGAYYSHPMMATENSILPPDAKIPIDWRIVSPGYFKTMNIPLLLGREFRYSDASTPNIIIVSQATARTFWGDENPIGRTLRRSADPDTPFTVVGVVGDVRSTQLSQESPAFYYSITTRTNPLMDVVVRTDGSPESLLPAIRKQIKALDPDLPMANVNTMEQWLTTSAAQPRLTSVLLSLFAGVALLIAAIGIYAVLTYSVSQRTREIGIRMALGATPRRVLELILSEGMRVVLLGLVIGLAGGLALGRTLESLVYGVGVRDPKIYFGVAAILTVVALAACFIPARRAAVVDPIVALREE
ncbi:MAG TPA: ABC transporter permease [Thermoanaerobaculia bacterium]|nr:ABC transporter permease [Thermoanaerobaculia bacterium]